MLTALIWGTAFVAQSVGMDYLGPCAFTATRNFIGCVALLPVISFASDGQLQSVAKVRGRRQVQDKILELMEQHIRPGVRYNLGIANGGAPEEMAEFAVRMKERFPDAVHMWEGEIDATLSVYIGDGVLGGGIQILED